MSDHYQERMRVDRSDMEVIVTGHCLKRVRTRILGLDVEEVDREMMEEVVPRLIRGSVPVLYNGGSTGLYNEKHDVIFVLDNTKVVTVIENSTYVDGHKRDVVEGMARCQTCGGIFQKELGECYCGEANYLYSMEVDDGN